MSETSAVTREAKLEAAARKALEYLDDMRFARIKRTTQEVRHVLSAALAPEPAAPRVEPRRPCDHPPCDGLALEDGYCTEHQKWWDGIRRTVVPTSPAAPAVAAPAVGNCKHDLPLWHPCSACGLDGSRPLECAPAPPLPLGALHAEGEAPSWDTIRKLTWTDAEVAVASTVAEELRQARARADALQAALTDARAQLEGAREEQLPLAKALMAIHAGGLPGHSIAFLACRHDDCAAAAKICSSPAARSTGKLAAQLDAVVKALLETAHTAHVLSEHDHCFDDCDASMCAIARAALAVARGAL